MKRREYYDEGKGKFTLRYDSERNGIWASPNEIVYMTADEEDIYTVAQANEPLDAEGHFLDKKVSARFRDEIIEVTPDRIDYMDVSPKMVVSVATACIPFLENDDNSRALMGSNMQKQAVPLMVTDSPIVATGMEYKAAVDSGTVVVAKEGGVVEYAAGSEIVILTDSGRNLHSQGSRCNITNNYNGIILFFGNKLAILYCFFFNHRNQ